MVAPLKWTSSPLGKWFSVDLHHILLIDWLIDNSFMKTSLKFRSCHNFTMRYNPPLTRTKKRSQINKVASKKECTAHTNLIKELLKRLVRVRTHFSCWWRMHRWCYIIWNFSLFFSRNILQIPINWIWALVTGYRLNILYWMSFVVELCDDCCTDAVVCVYLRQTCILWDFFHVVMQSMLSLYMYLARRVPWIIWMSEQ